MNLSPLRFFGRLGCLGLILTVCSSTTAAEVPKRTDVDAQPLVANVDRLLQALDILGAPVLSGIRQSIAEARSDAGRLQEVLDTNVLLVVSINPELRVKAARGPVAAHIHQSGFTPALVKVLNDAKTSLRLNIESPQAG